VDVTEGAEEEVKIDEEMISDVVFQFCEVVVEGKGDLNKTFDEIPDELLVDNGCCFRNRQDGQHVQSGKMEDSSTDVLARGTIKLEEEKESEEEEEADDD
jgi:hypothetical protein